jgi:hypothetical protein
MKLRLLTAAVLFLSVGCQRYKEQHYKAVGQIMATTICNQSYGRGHRDVKLIGLKTEDDLYLTIPFRIDQNFFYDPLKVGELAYHSCGADLYCFDSFRSLRPTVKDSK